MTDLHLASVLIGMVAGGLIMLIGLAVALAKVARDVDDAMETDR